MTGSLPGQGGSSSCGIPAGATAAHVSVIAASPTLSGYVRIWATGDPAPTATFLQYTAGQGITNSGSVPISSNGKVTVRNFTGSTDVVVDIAGYYLPVNAASPPADTSLYVPLAPCRAVDTRPYVWGGTATGILNAGEQRDWQMTGSLGKQGSSDNCNVPVGATAVAVSITAVEPSGTGYVRAWPAGQPAPVATVLSYTSNRGITNTTTVPLSSTGKITVRNFTGTTDVVVDVAGYFVRKNSSTLPPTAAAYVPVPPCRTVDTRSGAGGRLAPNTERTWRAAGSLTGQGGRSNCAVPTGSSAIEAGITAVAPTGVGYVRAWPAGDVAPNATFLQYSAGQGITNFGPIPIADDGRVTVRNFGSTTHLVLDVSGYYARVATTTPPALTPGRVTAGVQHSCAITSGATVACWGGLTDETLPTYNETPLAVAGLSGAVAIDAGGSETCAIVAGGAVRCWTPETTGTPPAVPGLSGASTISVGAGHACAIVSQSARCWGNNDFGQLGNGTTISSSTPVTVPGLPPIKSVSTSYHHTCAVPTDGTVRCWGSSSNGEIGTYSSSATPVKVPGVTNAKSVVAGVEHSCALLTSGSVRCWGTNFFGQLGVTGSPTAPTTVAGLSDATALMTDNEHTCAIVRSGEVRCWGRADNSQLGAGASGQSSWPVTVPGLAGATDITIGVDHSCASVTGGVRCWGGNRYGQVGAPNMGRMVTPTLSIQSGVTAVAAGFNQTCVLVSGGAGRCWGLGAYGPLGNGSNEDSPTPVAVRGLSGATTISGRNDTVCTTTSGASVRCWGNGYSGENGSWGPSSVPVTVANTSGATQVGSGRAYSCALVGGGVRCWGANDKGQLGSPGNATNVARAIPGLSGVVQISVGMEHACARLSNGTVRCWGNNDSGQLGNGTTNASTAPVTVTGLSSVTTIGAGDSFSCAVVSGASVRCWGANFDGQLGNDTGVNSSTPVTIPGITAATAIAVGGGHACVITTGGTVKCWGSNQTGELGNGTAQRSSTPVAATGLTGATGLSASLGTTCAVQSGGKLWCWGSNWNNQVVPNRYGMPQTVSV